MNANNLGLNLGGDKNDKNKSGYKVTGKGQMMLIGLATLILVLGYWSATRFFGGSENSSSGNVSDKSDGGGILSVFMRDAKADVSVCVVTWGGYAGGQYFNNGFKASKDSRYYKEYGITVEFVLIDDFVASREAWKSDRCQVLWITADSFPTESADLYKEHAPKIFFQADNSRGGDVAVAAHDIKSVADLRGKKVAFLGGSPSHTLLLSLLEAGGLSYADIQPVETASAPDAASAFKAENVSAAMVWSPDDKDVLDKVPGSHVLLSTKQATNIIADVFYAKASFIEDHHDDLVALVEGWLRGAAEINSDPNAKAMAVEILAEGLAQPRDFVENAINNARLSTYGDNLNFFGQDPSFRGVTGEELYTKMIGMYSKIGKAPSNVPAWRLVTDLSIIKDVKIVATGANAGEGNQKFEPPSAKMVSAPALATKRLTVTFATGSSLLDENARTIIDLGYGQISKGFGGNRIRIEGNTDSTGYLDDNRRLSQRRAQAVADYLVTKYAFDRNRFVIVGNGPDKPVSDNETSEGRSRNRRTDFELLAE